MTGPAPSGAGARRLGQIHLVIAALFFLSALYVIAVASWTTIVLDQWRIYDGYFARDFPHNVLASQNGHRPVLPGLLFLMDIYWFGAHNYLLNTLGVIMAVVAASAWSWAILRDEELDPTLRRVAMSLVWVLLFWLGNARVLGHGNESLHVFPVLCGLFLAVWALLRYRPDRSNDAPPRPPVGAVLLSVLGCLVATFSFGLGLATWAIIIGLAVILGYPRRSVAAILAVAAGVVALYFLALPGPTPTRSSGFRPLEILTDAVVWLGSPAFHALRPLDFLSDDLLIVGLGSVLGALGMAVGGWSFLTVVRRRARATDLELWSLAILGLGVGSALFVAFARGSLFDEFPQQRVAPRYLPWVCAFWAAAFTSVVLHVSRLCGHRVFARRIWLTLATILPLGLLPTHSGWNLEFAKHRTREAGVGLALGIRAPQLVERLFRRPAVVDRLAERLDALDLAMFAGRTEEELGTRFEEEYRAVAREGLAGGRLNLDELPDGDTFALRFWGKIQGPVNEYDQVVVVNDAGIIAGRGTIRGVGHRWARRIGLLANIVPQFGGYVPSYSRERTYTIYAVSTGRRVAAPLAAIEPTSRGRGPKATGRDP